MTNESKNGQNGVNGDIVKAGENDFFAQLQAQKMQHYLAAPTDPREIVNKIAGDDQEVARKVFGLLNMMESKEAGDTWRPEILNIAQKTTREDVINKIGIGNIYSAKGEVKFASGTKIFPLYAHEDFKWFSEEFKLISRSIDGARAEHFLGDYAGQVTAAEPPFWPHKPDRFYRGAQVPYGVTVYFVDRDFTNIYEVWAKSFSLKNFYDVIKDHTKKSGEIFGTEGSSWFTLGTNREVSKSNQSMSGYSFHAEVSGEKLSQSEEFAINSLKAFIYAHWRLRVQARDNKEASAQNTVDALDITVSRTVDEDGVSITSM